MQGPAWVSLFRRIPAELHQCLALVLNGGVEVLVNSILRLERDFMVVRGRMAGSMDSGRVTIVPFDQIIYLGVNKKMLEAEAQGFLSKPAAPQAALPEPVVEDEAPAENVSDENFMPESAAAPEPEPAPTPAEPAAPAANGAAPTVKDGPPAKPGQVSKSILLARLRARLAKDGSARPGAR